MLAEDFTTPEVLRTWPEVEGSHDYGSDGRYHVAVASRGDFPWAYAELPTEMDGVEITIDVEAVRGNPVVALLCIYDPFESTDPAGMTTVEDRGSFTFFYDPVLGSYAIAELQGPPIVEGTLEPGGGRLSVTCASSPEGTDLAMQLGDGEPVSASTDDARVFQGIALGALSLEGGGEVAFDDLRVTDASKEGAA